MVNDNPYAVFTIILNGEFAVCGAPKRRFKPYQPAVAKGANDTDVRKARKEQLKRDEAVG